MNTTIPNHITIIPDGNRRWAKEHKLTSLMGHKRGFDIAVKLSRKVRQMGVSTLTLWAFSTENWDRTPTEVKYLMRLYGILMDKYLKEAIKDEVKIIHIGRKDRIPKFLLKKIETAEEKTKNFSKYYLNIALDYGGRDEIVRAIHKASKNGGTDKITVDNFKDYLDTANQPHPYPDLVIRTSGEFRISGFMPWQAAYSEYLFVNKYFPELTEKDMEDAVEEYSRRQRRFGK